MKDIHKLQKENKLNNELLTIMVTLSVDGEIEDYVYYLVDAVRKISTRTVLVVNGEIKDNHKKRIIESGVDVFKRENTGFDSGAYKDALEKYTKVLYSQARLIEGLPIENPTEISNLICEIMSDK